MCCLTQTHMSPSRAYWLKRQVWRGHCLRQAPHISWYSIKDFGWETRWIIPLSTPISCAYTAWRSKTTLCVTLLCTLWQRTVSSYFHWAWKVQTSWWPLVRLQRKSCIIACKFHCRHIICGIHIVWDSRNPLALCRREWIRYRDWSEALAWVAKAKVII